MDVARYSPVMPLDAQVEGTLRPEMDAFDALRATFPAGTVSGAPKIRAMQIIAELEEDQRGPYAGALGYFGFGPRFVYTGHPIQGVLDLMQTVEPLGGWRLVYAIVYPMLWLAPVYLWSRRALRRRVLR